MSTSLPCGNLPWLLAITIPNENWDAIFSSMKRADLWHFHPLRGYRVIGPMKPLRLIPCANKWVAKATKVMTCNSWPNSQSLSWDSHSGWFYLKQNYMKHETWNILCKLLQLLTTWALYLRSTHLMCLGFNLHQIGIHLQDLDIVNATSNLVLTINIKKIWKLTLETFVNQNITSIFLLNQEGNINIPRKEILGDIE